jgi:hypothetical protein
MRRNHLHNRFLCRPSLHASTSGHRAVQNFTAVATKLAAGALHWFSPFKTTWHPTKPNLTQPNLRFTTHALLRLQDHHFSQIKAPPIDRIFCSSADNFSFQERDWLVLALIVPKLKGFYCRQVKGMAWKRQKMKL